MEKENSTEQIQPEEEKVPYKVAVIGKIKSIRPEFNSEDDDDVLKEIESLYDEAETERGVLKGFAKKITDIMAVDPKFGAVIELITDEESPKSFGYAVAKIYGKSFLGAEDEDIETGEAEYKANLKLIEEAKVSSEKNFQQYVDDLNAFCSDKTEEDKAKLHNAIMEEAENYLNGVIPTNTIEEKWKAINYDTDVEDAMKAGEVAGRNAKIDEKLKLKSEMPDMGQVSNQGGAKVVKKSNFFDAFK